MRHERPGSLLIAPAVALALCCSSGAAQEPPASMKDYDYDQALKKYRDYVKRPSLYKRTRARLVLAHTNDDRAFAILSKSYARPEPPKDQVRYLIASITARAFGSEDRAAALTAWRLKHKKPRDAWLWYEVLTTPAMAGQGKILREIAFGRDSAWLRSSALAAIARHPDADDEDDSGLAQQLLGLLESPPSDPIERALLLESCAAVLVAKRELVRGDTWKPVCTGLIASLEDKATLQRTRVALSRHFAKVFDSENLGFSPRLWLFKLSQEPTPKREGPARTVSAFFGIRSLGERIVYAIDASDSMMKKVSKKEKKRLAAITGPRSRIKKKGLPISERLPWDQIETRFDVAREYLKISLAELDKTKSFAVILFGTKAKPLASTPKLMPANFKNLKKAILELDSIKGGPPNPSRPDGVLRGFTNLHGAFLQGFRMTKGGLVARDEYVNGKALKDGCDTVFLLSDGAPSMDNWLKLDDRDPEDIAGDPETGVRHPNQKQLNFYGPYVEGPHKHIIEDITRLNLFRKAQIHCIGFGEADHGLLERIARIGLGKVVRINPPGQR